MRKLCIIGASGSGKDAVARWFQKYCGLNYFGSSSTYILPVAAEKLGISMEKIWDNKEVYRKHLLEVGDELFLKEPAYLVKRPSMDGSDLIVGLRRTAEFYLGYIDNYFQLSLGIVRPGRHQEDTLTGVTAQECDIQIINDQWQTTCVRLFRLATALGFFPTSAALEDQESLIDVPGYRYVHERKSKHTSTTTRPQ